MENEYFFYKNQRNKCVSFCKKCIKTYFKTFTDNGMATNKTFWKSTIKYLLTNKSCHEQKNIMLIKDGKIVSKEKDLVEAFNKHYINIVGNSSGIKPYNAVMENNVSEDNATMYLIIKAMTLKLCL